MNKFLREIHSLFVHEIPSFREWLAAAGKAWGWCLLIPLSFVVDGWSHYAHLSQIVEEYAWSLLPCAAYLLAFRIFFPRRRLRLVGMPPDLRERDLVMWVFLASILSFLALMGGHFLQGTSW